MNGGRRHFIHGVAIAGCCFLLCAGCGTSGTDLGNAGNSNSDWLEQVTEKGPVKLAVRIKPREPRLSDLVEMEILVSAPPEVDIKPPEFGQAVGDFLVRDYSEGTAKNQTEPTETSTRRFRYQLEPVQAGRHLIRSIPIEFVDNRPDSEARGKTALIESDPLEVEITSELGDQVPDLANLEPMVPPQQLAGASQWTWVLIGTGLLAAVLFGVWLLRRRKVRVKEPRRLTAEEIAHAAMLGLLSENLLGQGLFKDFYLRLTGIVRQYIEDTTGLKAPEQTTEEFLRDMRSKNVFPAERSVRLKEFLEAADMVKYAGQQPGEEQIELSIARAREFIDLRGGVEHD